MGPGVKDWGHKTDDDWVLENNHSLQVRQKCIYKVNCGWPQLPMGASVK